MSVAEATITKSAISMEESSLSLIDGSRPIDSLGCHHSATVDGSMLTEALAQHRWDKVQSEVKTSEFRAYDPATEDRRTNNRKDNDKLADRLQTLLYLLPAGVVVIDGRGTVQQCNAAATDLLGEPLEGEKWLNIITRCFSPRRDDGHEVSLKDGRRVSISIRTLDNEPGQLILITDLTETRELQAKLSRHERLSSMGKMVASLAHQVRTPLSTAMLYAGHLCEDTIDESMRKKCANKLMSRLVHLEQQVRDMLIFVKGDTPLAEKVMVGDLMHDLQSAAESPLKSAKAVVNWHIDHETDEILCNREALLGAIMNLINNSIEAGKSGVVLDVSFGKVSQGQVRFSVKDNGPGLSNGSKDKVTEAFYTTKPQGTGLGLAVVKAVTKAHKGQFDIRSSKAGTIAAMDLPLVG